MAACEPFFRVESERETQPNALSSSPWLRLARSRSTTQLSLTAALTILPGTHMSQLRQHADTHIKRDDLFSATSWTVVMTALNDTPQAREALEQLCNKYWYPVYAYIRRRGYGPHDAEDLTQSFFLEIVDNKRLRSANRAKGKFRAYLLAGLNGFLVNHWHFTHAAKRGGGKAIISLDAEIAEQRYAIEPVSDISPEKIFEQRWATTVVEHVHVLLRQEFLKADKAEHYEALKDLLSDTTEKKSYGPLAVRLGMTANALAVAVHRLRQRFRKLLRDEIARTVGDPAETDAEMRHLFSILAETSS